MRLEALELAVQYHCNLPASVPNNPNLVLDTTGKFMLFLTQDALKADNPPIGGSGDKALKPNLKRSGQPRSGS